MIKPFAHLLLIFFSVGFLQAQDNFSDYRTIKSAGEVPADFITTSKVKVLQDIESNRTKLTSSKAKIFLNGIHYSIDDLLQSGKVVYGDEISVYVQKIADRLLKDKPELRKELRFYTIKSSETNALSTDQGIVFVTTGLISQLTSEAQLAYVLAHEIAHYTEKHVMKTFDWKSKNPYSESKIKDYNAFSKENELEADQKGLKIYIDAGYSLKEIVSTFDVLMYSYLPFDEMEIQPAYFSTKNMYLPDFLFSKKKFEIKAEEDYNDEKSSHPNIKKRKAAVKEILKGYNVEGDTGTVFFQDEKTFTYLRDLARFECVRTDLIDQEYTNVLYSIFLLEKKFPNSIYLERMKAQAWFGIAKNVKENQSTYSSKYYEEGERGAVYYLFRRLKKSGIQTLALRTVYDLNQKHTADPVISGVMDLMLKSLANDPFFNWEKYSSMNFDQAMQFKKAVLDSIGSDPVKQAEFEQSKYDKIKKQKANFESIEQIDSNKYYLFGISDILLDTTLRANFEGYKKEIDDKKISFDDENAFTAMLLEQILNINSNLNLGVSRCIFLEPKVFVESKNGTDYAKIDLIKNQTNLAVKQAGINQEMTLTTISMDDVAAKGTDLFNDKIIAASLMNQLSTSDSKENLTVDFADLKVLAEKYQTDYLLLTKIQNNLYNQGNQIIFTSSASDGYESEAQTASPMSSSSNVSIVIWVVDLKSGRINTSMQEYSFIKFSKTSILKFMEDFFLQLKTEKKEEVKEEEKTEEPKSTEEGSEEKK